MDFPARRCIPAALGTVVLLAVGAFCLGGLSVESVVEPLRSLTALGQLQPQALMEAVGYTVLAILINGLVWSRLLARLGYDLPVEVGLGVFLSSDLAAMIANVPGAAVGSAVSLRRHGVCPGRAVLLSIMANLLGFCSILVWVPVGILLLRRPGMENAVPLLGKHAWSTAAVVLIGAVAASLIAMKALTGADKVGNKLGRRLLRKAPMSEASGKPALRFRHLLRLVPGVGVSWLAGALALYAILSALAADRSVNLGDVVGSAALAAMLGSMAFFLPSGVGVRDGVLIALLVHSTGLSFATCTEAAIVMRVMDPLAKIGILFLLAVGVPGRARRVGAILGSAARRTSSKALRPVPVLVPVPVPSFIAANLKNRV
jgi:glycosyltransferase 2 family protein